MVIEQAVLLCELTADVMGQVSRRENRGIRFIVDFDVEGVFDIHDEFHGIQAHDSALPRLVWYESQCAIQNSTGC
ncbi:MAG: hypothetical protein C0478_01445 [Planctomyces sp.]|nr:hypothetical protein [Planctomyces sp.]